MGHYSNTSQMASKLLAPNSTELPRHTNRPTSPRWLKRRLTFIFILCSTTVLLVCRHVGAFNRVWLSPRDSGFSTMQPEEPLVVTLPGYGSFKGTQMVENFRKTKLFDPPVDAWMGVEFSVQPVGDNRFKAATWPESFTDTKDATSSGPGCLQNIFSTLGQSEACLTIDVYRPSNKSMDDKLPVLVFLHGGSFVVGSHRGFDGALFVANSKQPLMVVTAQYRLGVLGSLPARFMEEEGLLNLGIRDQKMMLEFVHKYIGEFGGDSNKITLSGQSAGGHSVGIHLFHNYDKDVEHPLFSQAILASGSPTARAFPGVDYPLYQQQVEYLMIYLGCPLAPNSAALKCLRAAEVGRIQFISTALYNAYNYNITWPWQPVSPGALLEKRGSESGADGTFFKIPIMISSTSDEGKSFAPQDLTTNDEFLEFWSNLAPGLSTEDMTDLQRLYPDVNPASVVNTTNYVSMQFERIAAAYGDYSYICPVQDVASRLAAAGATVYKARFNTPNWAPAYMGVPHASDAAYFNGQTGTQYPEIAELYSAYWASFVASGDPNTYAAEGAPKWKTYAGADSNGTELLVNPPYKGGAKMEKEKEGIRMKACRWWRDQDRAKRLNK